MMQHSLTAAFSVTIFATVAAVSVANATPMTSNQLPLRCAILIEPAIAGAAIWRDSVRMDLCSPTSMAGPVGYRAMDGTVRARSNLSAGTSIGALWLPRRPAVQRGQVVLVTVRMGNVAITREAVALQTANSNEAFFAQDGNGTVFRAPPIFARDRH
jgi:hypothetical protein